MAFNVRFYTLSKKHNSTLHPTDSDSPSDYACELKADCSIITPVIMLQLPLTTTTHLKKNYCYIATFNRYYYITDWFFTDGLWNAALKCDVMATYKTQIGSESQYILRASNSYDANVVDTLYPAKVGTTLKRTTGTWADSSWTYSPESGNGSYIVGIINNNEVVNGTIVYYVLTGGQMAAFRAFMLGSIKEWSDITSFTGDVAKAFIDPFQYVVSCIWFPFNVPSASQVSICFGYWESDLHAGVLDKFTVTRSCQVVRPTRDDNSTLRGNWEYLSPFADYYLLAYPWGVIPIDGTAIDTNGLLCEITIDLITGLGLLQVSKFINSTIAQASVISTHTAQLGVQMQLSQVTTDYGGLATASGLGGLIKSAIGGISGAINTFLGSDQNIASAAQAGMSHASTSGQSGGVVYMPKTGVCYLFAKFFDPVEEYNDEKGRPYCKVAKPMDIGGYMVVENGDIKLPSTEAEMLEVQSILEGGFYYE